MFIAVCTAVAQRAVLLCVCVCVSCNETESGAAKVSESMQMAFPLGSLVATPCEDPMFAVSFVSMVAD